MPEQKMQCMSYSSDSDRSYVNQCSFDSGHEGAHSHEQVVQDTRPRVLNDPPARAFLGEPACADPDCPCNANPGSRLGVGAAAFGPGGCVRDESRFPGLDGETTQTLQLQVCKHCGHDPELCAAAAELGIDLHAIPPRKDLNDYATESHDDNMQWWMPLDPTVEVDGRVLIAPKLVRNKPELLMLIVSEIAECMEGVRKDVMDDKLPHRKMEEVELADALIRIFDYAGAHDLDIEGAYQEKRAFNKQRADHKAEARKGEGGKQF